MRVANASNKQGLDQVIHQATDKSYGSDATRVAGEDGTREVETIIKRRAREGEQNTHTPIHTHAHTHIHTRAYTHKPVCFKTLCLTLLFCGEKKITFKCNHFVSGRAVPGSRGTLLLVLSQDPSRFFPRVYAPQLPKGAPDRGEPDVCDSVDPGQLGIPVHARAMCDFYEACGTAGSAARAIGH